MDLSREIGKEILLLNIDYDKPYNKVYWEFILHMLTCFMFGNKFV